MAPSSSSYYPFHNPNGTVTAPDDLTPLQAGLLCYSIPFGVLGSVSHLVTLYEVICLTFGHKPLLPFSSLSRDFFWILWDLGLAVGSPVVVTFAAGHSVLKCFSVGQQRLAFVAIWKISLSLALAVLHIALPLRTWKHRKEQVHDPWHYVKYTQWWIMLFLLGTIVGLFGLVRVVRDNWYVVPNIRLVTFVTLPIGILLAVLLCIFWRCFFSESTGRFNIPLGLTLFVTVIWSDWILAVASGNYIGGPLTKGTVVVYFWVYFIAKRLPLLMW